MFYDCISGVVKEDRKRAKLKVEDVYIISEEGT
jgi:hypothetical protein